MQTLTQIIYISRSTFLPVEATNGIEPNVARILLKSRVNNKKNGLVGVLYFGDGCFFQCLEGEKNAVESLYAKLLQDTRHKDLKIISQKDISHLSFAEWAMKYVPLDVPMSNMLRQHGFSTFDPYLFDDAMHQKVLTLLHANNNLPLETKFEHAALAVKEPTSRDMRYVKFALMLSIISTVLSIFTLLIVLNK